MSEIDQKRLNGRGGVSEWGLAILSSFDEHRATWLRIGVVAITLLYVAGLSVLVAVKPVTYALILAGLPLAVAFVLFIQNRLYLTPAVLLFVAAYVPLSLPTGTGSRLVASLLLATVFSGLWLLRMVVVDKHFHFTRTPMNIPVVGFAVAVTISLVWSIIFRDPNVFVPGSFIFVQIASMLVMIISPVVMMLVGNQVHEARTLKVMAVLMISVGFFGLVENITHINLPVNSFGLAGMWIVGLSTAIAFFDKKMPLVWRGALLLLALLWIYTSFVLNLSWIAGWLPGFIAGGVIAFLRSKRLLFGLLVVLAIYAVLNFSHIKNDLALETRTSGDTRVSAWQINWSFTSQHILFGMGPAGYAVYYMTYNPTDAMATHSNYIDILSETGVIGTIFYLGIFAVLLWRGLVVYSRLKGKRNFLEALTVAALGGTVGCLVIMAFGDWLIPFAYTQTIAGFNYSVYNWIFMGTILSLDYMTRPKSVEA